MSKKSVAKKPAAKRIAKKVASRKPAVAKQAISATSRFAASKLYPSKAVAKANPRREGSHGFKSLAIIITKPGITYAAFLAAGGRNKDLRYDIAQKHAEARG
jgi:hypothetical protein